MLDLDTLLHEVHGQDYTSEAWTNMDGQVSSVQDSTFGVSTGVPITCQG